MQQRRLSMQTTENHHGQHGRLIKQHQEVHQIGRGQIPNRRDQEYH